MFGNLSEKFEGALRKLSGKGEISESNVREAMDDVRTALLEADVHYEVAENFCEAVLKKALGTEVLQSVKPGEQMIKIVHDELVTMISPPAPPEVSTETGLDDGGLSLDDPASALTGMPQPSLANAGGGEPIMFVSPGPTVIMMAGLQGSGKTTTCGKLAAYLKKRGKSVMLCAADLQRPAAVKQLQVLSEQAETEVEPGGQGAKVSFYGEPEKCAEYGKAVNVAVDVCRAALKQAKADKVDVLILDTAGRLHINDDLMNELRLVNAAVMPHQIFLVIDAMTGQDAVNSAKAFNERLELDGVILTKFDSDTRGGAALSVKQITGKPIKFMGTGEKLDGLEVFHADRVAGRILGMGDIVSLVEKAQEQVSEEEAMALQDKMAKGQMTMDDFLSQLKKIRKLGSMKSLLGMLPGVGSQLKDLDLDEKQIDRTQAIIQSMTLEERKLPKVLNNSRRRRVGSGSGTTQQDVSKLVKGFETVSQLGQLMGGMDGSGKGGKGGMMKQLSAMRQMAASGGMGAGGMPGMPKMKGGTKRVRQAKPKRRGRR